MIHRRTHPNLDVEGCFACKVSTTRFLVPPDFKAQNISDASTSKQEIQEALKNDKEGVWERAR